LEDNAEDALANFFSTTDFTNLAGQLQKRWGDQALQLDVQGACPAADLKVQAGCNGRTSKPSTSNYTMENPYIVALQRRRDALLRTNEGWAKWADDDHVEVNDSVASRLAQKQDSMAILKVQQFGSETQDREYCAMFCTTHCVSNGGPRGFQTMDYEMSPTPRVHRYNTLNSRLETDEEDLPEDPPWAAEAASQHASRTSADAPVSAGYTDSIDTDSAFKHATADGPNSAKQESTLVVEMRAVRESSSEDDADASFLASLLLASDEFGLSSDEEGKEGETAPENDIVVEGSQKNIAAGMVKAIQPGSGF
jgi:hypothetical protein